MDTLSSDVLLCFKSALNKLTGYKRRDYAAELCELLDGFCGQVLR